MNTVIPSISFIAVIYLTVNNFDDERSMALFNQNNRGFLE